MMPSILITTSSFDLNAPEITKIRDAGYTVKMNPHGRRITEDEAIALLTPDVVGMIAGVEPLTRKVLQEAKGLKIISRCGAGLDSVDMDAAGERNICVRNTPDAPAVAVAELTIGLILSLLRHIPQQDRSIRNGDWDRPMGSLLSKKTLGIIGYGRIGRRVGEIAKAFGGEVIVYDPMIATNATLDHVLEQSDIVSLHIPYTNENRHLIDSTSLKKMKVGSVLINASRGGLVDEKAVADYLRSGHLGGAAFDVFEEEPYSGELKDLPNVVLTPHVGSYAREARAMQEAESAANLYEELKAQQRK
jgi:D-3-phosphoglycerate dehydrogenase